MKEQIKNLMARLRGGGVPVLAPTPGAPADAPAPVKTGAPAQAAPQANAPAGDACPIPTGIDVVSPMAGEIRPLSEVPDPVFAEKMMGDGFCVVPKDGRVVAPVTGTVVTLFPTHHAIGLRTPDGLELLVHVGVDTVKLQGEGFKPLVAEGAEVQAGQPLLDVDLEQVRKKVPSVTTPVVFTNLEGREWRITQEGTVTAGDVVARVDPPKA